MLRLAAGAVVLSHGLDKVAGGMDAHVASVGRSLHLHWTLAYLWAYLEVAGGALLLLGLWTRWAAVAVAVVTAASLARFPLLQARLPARVELPLTVLAAAIAVALLGGGWLSLDRHLLRRE